MNIYHSKCNISFFINFKIIRIMFINYSNKDSFNEMTIILAISTYSCQFLNIKIILSTLKIKMSLIFNNFCNNYCVKIKIFKIFILYLM